MASSPLPAAEINALLTELRAMALLPPGQDDTALARARAIGVVLQAQERGGRTVGQAVARVLAALEILLSRRRWKQEAPSVEALRKQIKLACDQLRVAVERVVRERPAG